VNRSPSHLVGAAGVLLAAFGPGRLSAQAWNGDSALALAGRAIERRTRLVTDTALQDYRAEAHGFVFFLGQLGEGMSEPPRLVKADELALEVYWKAPNLSKQRVIGWRDRRDLPTDINYHRDHLGIVQNNFGNFIRLGEGDEVRDVPHPLAPDGPSRYDFALGDTLILALPQRSVRVVSLLVRPRNFAAPGLVGNLYLDAETAELVRMAFNFTPAAYIDRQLEDISITLDNALWEGRWWLPYRQSIEIRRRAEWLDFPARGIIRGRWEIGNYVFNVGLAAGWFAGPEIAFAPPADRAQFPWAIPLDEAVKEVAPALRREDLEEVRSQVEAIAGRRALTGLASRQFGGGGISDWAHVNRVEGLTLGSGVVLRGRGDRFEARGTIRYGFADRRPKAELRLSDRRGRSTLEVGVFRSLRDVGDFAVVSGAVNSFTSQELGKDYGDYYLATGARLGFEHRVLPTGALRFGVSIEDIQSVGVNATSASGAYRPNPALGDGRYVTVELRMVERSASYAQPRSGSSDTRVEVGWGEGRRYVRGVMGLSAQQKVGPTRLVGRYEFGIASYDLPAHRSFVLGGRGTLIGEPFRAFGGRRYQWGALEWQLDVPFPSVGVGQYARTPRRITVAPFLAAGEADWAVSGVPYVPSGGRVTVGVAIEWFSLIRIEIGRGLESHRTAVYADVTRALWGVL
jgi:hypothetical protein